MARAVRSWQTRSAAAGSPSPLTLRPLTPRAPLLAQAGSGAVGRGALEPYYLGILRGMCSGPYRGWAEPRRAETWPAGLGPGSGGEVCVSRGRGCRRAAAREVRAGARAARALLAPTAAWKEPRGPSVERLCPAGWLYSPLSPATTLSSLTSPGAVMRYLSPVVYVN